MLIAACMRADAWLRPFVAGCMQTQAKLQLDARDSGAYVAPAFMAVPQTQSMDSYGATPQAGFYP